MQSSFRIDKAKTSLRLKAAAARQNLKQADIASKTGINQSQVSRLLKGKFQRRSKNLNALCQILNVKVAVAKGEISLSQYPDLSACLSEIMDGTRQKESAVVQLLNSARKIG